MIQVKDFQGETDAKQIQNAIEAASKSSTKTVQLEERDYSITETVLVKKNVELLFPYGSKFVIDANVPVLEVETNASITNPYVAINSPEFDSYVFGLDGKHRYYNTWNKTAITHGVVVNWAGSLKGTGIYLYAGGANHEISFVNIVDVKFAGLKRGIHLKADKPATGMAWVNANRFQDISLDDCVHMITIESGETVPNECSGNMFTGLQIQPSASTESILTVNGQQNRFEGMLWDTALLAGTHPVVTLTKQSSMNKLDFNGSLPKTRVQNAGINNIIL